MTTFDLNRVKLRSGEQVRETVEVELEPIELGGERYVPVPERPEATLQITKASSGTLFELALDARLVGACMRCVGEAAADVSVRGREYQDASPGDAEELRTPYLEDGRLDLSAWARDAVALSLPDKILCREDCAGLCGRCGADLNLEECTCGPPEPDPRWAALADLRERL